MSRGNQFRLPIADYVIAPRRAISNNGGPKPHYSPNPAAIFLSFTQMRKFPDTWVFSYSKIQASNEFQKQPKKGTLPGLVPPK